MTASSGEAPSPTCASGMQRGALTRAKASNACRGLPLASLAATTEPNIREIALESRPRIARGNGTYVAIRPD